MSPTPASAAKQSKASASAGDKGSASGADPSASHTDPSTDDGDPSAYETDPAVAQLLAAFSFIGDFVKSCEVGRFTGKDAGEMVKHFSRARRFLSAGESAFVRRVRETRLHQQCGDKQLQTWLSRATGEPEAQSASKLDTARKLEAHPQVQEAFRSGELSEAQAREIADTAEVCPKETGDLIRDAPKLTFSELKKRCSDARSGATSADDEITRHRRIHKDRYCRTWVGPDGAGHLDARMTSDALGVLRAKLGLFEAEVFAGARRAGRRESRRAYMVDALVAMAHAASPGGSGSGCSGSGCCSGDGSGDPDDAGDNGGAGDPGDNDAAGDNQSGDSAGGAKHTKRHRRSFDPKALVRIRVDAEAFFRGYAAQGETCSIPGVGPVPVAAARALLGDALLELVITKGVDVTTVVSDSRFVRKALRIALEERDPTCVVPGCDRSDPLERDHWRVDFGKEGPTSIDNLCRLCSWHHAQKTYRGWNLEGGPGNWRFFKPDHSSGQGSGVTGSAEAKEARRRATRANDPPGTDPPIQEPML
jgi:hypothetical protein